MSLDHVVEETLYVLDVAEAFAVAGKVRKEACHRAASVRQQSDQRIEAGLSRAAPQIVFKAVFASSIDPRELISARGCQMLAYNGSAHAFFNSAKGNIQKPGPVRDLGQRGEDQSAGDEYGRFSVTRLIARH